MDDVQSDLENALRELDVEGKVIVAGHSWGGGSGCECLGVHGHAGAMGGGQQGDPAFPG